MTNDERKARLPVSPFADIEVGDVIDIIEPHPYCITPKHVAYAADHKNGLLTEDAIIEAEKYGQAVCDTCRYMNKKGHQPILPYLQHGKGVTIVFLRIEAKGRAPKDIPHLAEFTKSLVPRLEELKIDGVSLVDVTKKEGKKK